MKRFILWITNIFIKNGIVESDSVEWLQYGLEKRITTLIFGIPCFLLAVLLTNVQAALAFHISFYLLRSRMNGYHTKSVLMCFLFSLLAEIICLGLLYWVMDDIHSVVILAISAILVIVIAPYNHPAMHLTAEEIVASHRSARIRVIFLLVIWVFCNIVRMTALSTGITLGVALASFLLCLAYLVKGGAENEQVSRSCKSSCDKACSKDD